MDNPLRSGKRYLVRFAVEGSGDFPIDMLRYDGAFPATERDSYKISEFDHRRVELEAWADGPSTRVPTEDRWKSFLWKVVP